MILVYFSFGAYQQGRRKNAPPASSSTTDTAAPRLKLTQPKFDVGPMVQDEPVKRSTTVSNAGSLGLNRPKEVAIAYECKVGGTLEVNPTNPFFNLKVSGTKAVTIDVRSSQPNFEVMSVYVVEGPFAASFEHAAEGPSFLVKVTVLDDHIDDETPGVTGKLIIVSNDRTEPQKELPLFGLGAVNRATPLAPELAP